jgi:sulfite exporter TauE/SafE
MDNISLISIISIAFFGSMGHCIGMCGGIVIAYSSAKVNPNKPKISQATAHLIYNLGRVTTYTVMGVVFGALGGIVPINNITIATLTILAGIFMILAGLSISGKIKFLTLLEHSFVKAKWYQESFRAILQSKSLYSFFTLGMLNGLLPCGLVYFFAVTAASTASAFWGGVVMFIFGISTIPSLFILGMLTNYFKEQNFRKVMINLTSIIVIAFGIYTIYRGYDYIKHPDKSLLNCCEGSDSLDIDNKKNYPEFQIKKKN